MGNFVKFESFSIDVKDLIESKALIALNEAVGEIKAAAVDNTRVKSGNTQQKWETDVDNDKLEGYVGSKLKNALYEEFGTGEHGINPDYSYRKGYWVYVEGSEENEDKEKKRYTLEEAKRITAILRSKGLDAHYTKGKRPSRALHKAFEGKKKTVKKIFEHYLGEINDGG